MVYYGIDNKTWRSKLRIGDNVVILAGSGIGNHDRFSSVLRFTKTLIITEGEQKFRRDDGQAPGSGWHNPSLAMPTQELIDRIRREGLIRLFRWFDWSTLPLETLVEIRSHIPKKST